MWICTCEWNGRWMRKASLSPLAACEKTTSAGDGKWADPYSEPSIVIYPINCMLNDRSEVFTVELDDYFYFLNDLFLKSTIQNEIKVFRLNFQCFSICKIKKYYFQLPNDNPEIKSIVIGLVACTTNFFIKSVDKITVIGTCVTFGLTIKRTVSD